MTDLERETDIRQRWAIQAWHATNGTDRPVVNLVDAEFIATRLDMYRKQAADYERTFNLQWDADQRAIKQWQEAHPGNDMVWPDRCNMVAWLLDKLQAYVSPPL